MANLKTKIIKHLQEKGSYSEEIDSDMIDDLIENTIFAKKVFKQLKEEGAVISYVTQAGSHMTKINPLLSAHQILTRNVYQLASKLGLNRSDRMRLKLIEQKTKDELDKLMED